MSDFHEHKDKTIEGSFFNTIGGIRIRLYTHTNNDGEWACKISVKRWAGGRMRGSSYANIGYYYRSGFDSRAKAYDHAEQKFDEIVDRARKYDEDPKILYSQLTTVEETR